MQKFNLIKRWQNVKIYFKQQKITAFLTFTPSDLFYFTGFTGDIGKLLFINSRNLKIILFTNSLYFEQAKKECPKEVLIIKDNFFIKKSSFLLKKYNSKKVFVNYKNLEAINYLALKNGLSKKIVLFNDFLPLREIKDKTEINLIKESCKQAASIFKKVINYVAINKTEIEVAKYAQSLILKTNGEQLSFPFIIASGKNSAYPHWQPSNKKLALGDLVIFDWGITYKKYCSDITRTFIVGKPSALQKTIYQIVLDCQLEILSQIKEGVRTNILMKLARKKLNKFKKYFVHGLGHSLGLEIHEPPFLNLKNKEILKENMIITVEPGIYIPGTGGIRIEDTVLVKKNSSEVLSQIPKNLIEA